MHTCYLGHVSLLIGSHVGRKMERSHAELVLHRKRKNISRERKWCNSKHIELPRRWLHSTPAPPRSSHRSKISPRRWQGNLVGQALEHSDDFVHLLPLNVHPRLQEAHLALLVQQDKLHVEDSLARRELLLPGHRKQSSQRRWPRGAVHLQAEPREEASVRRQSLSCAREFITASDSFSHVVRPCCTAN